MLSTIIISVLTSGAFAAFVTAIITKKKYKAETLSIELDNANKIINMWKTLSEEQSRQIIELQKKVQELSTDFKALERLYEAQCNNCVYRKEYEQK